MFDGCSRYTLDNLPLFFVDNQREKSGVDTFKWPENKNISAKNNIIIQQRRTPTKTIRRDIRCGEQQVALLTSSRSYVGARKDTFNERTI